MRPYRELGPRQPAPDERDAVAHPLRDAQVGPLHPCLQRFAAKQARTRVR